ncbi:hypothetical protein ACFE04_024635 [Oxalis oulophora]
MGNCQAIDAAALVIQHPCGKIERFYWPIIASEVMKLNPGHYVSLIIPLPPVSDQDHKTVRFTRVKLLRPTDTLALGHAYRLVTTQEVMKVLRAKKFAKSKRQNPETIDKLLEKKSLTTEAEDEDKSDQEVIHRPKSKTSSNGVTRSKSWRPKLHSILEASI